MTVDSAEPREIRKFGLVAFFFFGCLCATGIWRDKIIITYFFGAMSVLGMGLILFPAPLKPLYAAWLKIAHIIGRIVTIVVLSLAYYLVIAPSALIKRLLGGRPLPIKPDKEASSYWVNRNESAQPKERFLKRY
jgi:hypothetical protein